jgi:hypothetical protein
MLYLCPILLKAIHNKAYAVVDARYRQVHCLFFFIVCRIRGFLINSKRVVEYINIYIIKQINQYVI